MPVAATFSVSLGDLPREAQPGHSRESTMQELKVTVTDMTGLDVLRPATGGVPIAKGAAPEGTQFSLLDEDGEVVDCQTSVLARWEDRSVRWVLLDLMSKPPANATRAYTLRGSEQGSDAGGSEGVKVTSGSAPSLTSGDMEIVTAGDGLVRIAGRIEVRLCATDSSGKQYEARAESV